MTNETRLEAIRPWRIYRGRGGQRLLLGLIEARDEETALQMATKQFGVTEPHLQKQRAAGA
jgi:hypothetical protein